MSNYCPDDLKNTLIYIKNRFGVEIFSEQGRIISIFCDLAPGLKKDCIMLERMSRIGILKDFVCCSCKAESEQKRVVQKAMETLTLAELIRNDAAAYYLNVLTDVFGWKICVEIPEESLRFKPLEGVQYINAEVLLKRGFLALEEGEFKNAGSFFERVLNIDAECGQAYWGKTLCFFQSRNKEQFVIEVWKRIYSAGAPEIIEYDIVALAREADKETGILSEISDEELKNLLKDLSENGRNKCKSYIKYYEIVLHHMDSEVIGNCSNVVKCSDYNRALKYADNTIKEIPVYLKNYITNTIDSEKKREVQTNQNVRDNLFFEIQNRILDVIKKDPMMKDRIQSEKTLAERKAEEEYKNALSEYDQQYQQELSDLEDRYRAVLDKWEKVNNEYVKNYDSRVKYRDELLTEIQQKIEERAGLNGWDTILKKLELTFAIEELKIKKDSIIIPSLPGDKPQKGPLPAKGPMPVKKNYKAFLSEKGENYFAMIRCALSPEIKRQWDEKQIMLEHLKKMSNSFGRYPQSKSKEYTPLKWRILDVDKNSALLITDRVLEIKQFHKFTMKNIDDESFWIKSWKHSDLRKWLNGEFIEKTFSETEKQLLISSLNIPEKNPDYNSNPGDRTLDRAFLLSIKEAEQYFNSDADRQAMLTSYGDPHDYFANKDNGNCSWWLRTVGRFSDFAACVDINGTINKTGNHVETKYSIGVRPAIKVNLNELIKRAKK